MKKVVDLSKRKELEEEFWNAKFQKELILRMKLGQPIDSSLASNILSLPEKSPVRQHFTALLEGRKEENSKNDKYIDSK